MKPFDKRESQEAVLESLKQENQKFLDDEEITNLFKVVCKSKIK